MGKHHAAHRRNRRAQFVNEPQRANGTPTALLLGVGFLFLGTLIFVLFRGPSTGAASWSSAPEAAAAGADVVLDAAQFDDGQARFYRYATAGGREVKFFVMKSSDGVVRAAFDACDECFRARRGYRQSGDVMICNNCSRTFPSTQINVVKGGCNPAPIDRDLQGGRVVLRAAALAQGTAFF
jgi:uncharacterized membrane protein